MSRGNSIIPVHVSIIRFERLRSMPSTKPLPVRKLIIINIVQEPISLPSKVLVNIRRTHSLNAILLCGGNSTTTSSRARKRFVDPFCATKGVASAQNLFVRCQLGGEGCKVAAESTRYDDLHGLLQVCLLKCLHQIGHYNCG